MYLVSHTDARRARSEFLDGQVRMAGDHFEAVSVKHLVKIQGGHVGWLAGMVSESRQLGIAALGGESEPVVLDRQKAGAGSGIEETVGELVRHGSRHELAKEYGASLEVPANGAVGAQCPAA